VHIVISEAVAACFVFLNLFDGWNQQESILV
jgi:hypothetical protein